MKIGVALLLLLLAAAAPAPADPRLPSWEQSHLVEGDQTTRILRAFAYCSVRMRAAEAEALLATARGSAGEQSAIQTVVGEGHNRCLFRARVMRFRGDSGIALFRGLLAEFLYNRDTAGSRRHVPRAFDPRAAGPADPGREMAVCTVHGAPSSVHALIRFNHDSPGETRTLRALRPMMLNCLPPGRSLDVSRHVARALLAEALYHFSRENQPPDS